MPSSTAPLTGLAIMSKVLPMLTKVFIAEVPKPAVKPSQKPKSSFLSALAIFIEPITGLTTVCQPVVTESISVPIGIIV